MNSENYRMDFDERKQYVYDKAIDILESDEDVFVEACEELDNWDGFLGDSRCEDMDMIDEFFDKPSDLLDKMDDFNSDDSYFYFTAYGYVSTTDSKYTVYSDDFSATVPAATYCSPNCRSTSSADSDAQAAWKTLLPTRIVVRVLSNRSQIHRAFWARLLPLSAMVRSRTLLTAV